MEEEDVRMIIDRVPLMKKNNRDSRMLIKVTLKD